MVESAPDLAAVHAAASRIRGRVVHTPVVRVPAFDERVGANLWLKAENLQAIGAFKARGAMHAIGRLEAEARESGVLTFSSGNHAQAVALAARSYGVPATITMPTDAPAVKVAVVRELGAEIVFAGTTSDQRRSAALELQAQRGGTIIQPFDDPDIIAGAATATLELATHAREQGAPLDALFVPVGGGGLIAGACIVAAAEGFDVHSVEPWGCDALAQSIEAGQRVAVQPGPTISDGLKPVRVGELNFAIAKARVTRCHRVDDDEVGAALVALLMRGKLLVEPSGAAALAAAFREVPRLGTTAPPLNIGVLLSGGNVDPSVLGRLIDQHGAT